MGLLLKKKKICFGVLVAGGLRYHGMAPLVSHVYELGFMEAVAIPQTECFQGTCLALIICLRSFCVVSNLRFCVFSVVGDYCACYSSRFQNFDHLSLLMEVIIERA